MGPLRPARGDQEADEPHLQLTTSFPLWAGDTLIHVLVDPPRDDS